MKVLRKLLALVVVLLLIGGGATYALTPQEDIKTTQTLSQVDAQTTLQDLNQDFINNISYDNSKLSTSLKIDNATFLSLLKNATAGNTQVQNGTYSLVGDHIEAKLPVDIAMINSQVSTNVKVSSDNNNVKLTLEDAKVGKIPVPNFLLEQVLKQALSGSGASGVSVSGNTISLSSAALGLPVSVDNVEVSGGNINLTASLTNAQLLQYASQSLRGFLG